VAGYNPKKGAAACFFTLNLIPFGWVAGHSPKRDAADLENHEKIPLFNCFWLGIWRNGVLFILILTRFFHLVCRNSGWACSEIRTKTRNPPKSQYSVFQGIAGQARNDRKQEQGIAGQTRNDSQFHLRSKIY